MKAPFRSTLGESRMWTVARRTFFLLLSLIALLSTARAQHLHIQTSFTTAAGWDVFWHDFDSGDFSAADYTPRLTASMRQKIPALAALTNVLGRVGDPVWILPEAATASAPSIGFGTQGSGLSGGQIRLRLASFSGPGDFAMFANDPFGDAQIYAATRDGLGPEDGVTLGYPGGHTHLNLAFSRPGLYRLGWRAEGTITVTGQATNSPTVVFSFLVAPPAAPRLRLLGTNAASGLLVLSVESEPGLPIRIDTSTNAAVWSPWTNLGPASADWSVTVTNLPPSQFFRAVHPIP